MASAPKRQKASRSGLSRTRKIKSRSSSSQRFRPEQRLRKRAQFQLVFKKGLFARGQYLNMWTYLEAVPGVSPAGPKSGFIVSRKTSNKATVRNVWKRRMRECFRKNQMRIKPEALILMESRRGKKEIPSSEQLNQEILSLLNKAGCLK